MEGKDSAASDREAGSKASQGWGLLVIYQQFHGDVPWSYLEGKDWVVLSFAEEEWEEHFRTACRERHINVKEVLRASDYIDQASLIAREKYLNFVATWPQTFKKNGKNFKEYFTYKGELSYWWLSNASFKDNEISPTFEYLCHLEVIRKFLKEPGLLGCVVVTDDKEMSLLLARCCTQSNLSFASVGKLKVRRDTAFLKGLGSRIKFVLLLSLNLILSRVVLPRPRYEGPAGGVGFLTIYPDCLNLQGEAPVEENYLDLPETVASLRGTGSTLFAVHQPSAPSSWYKLLTWRKWLSQPQNPRIVFLSRYSHISDIGLAMLNFLFVFRYFWLDRMDRRFRSSFVYDGVNVYGLVGREFRRWFFSSQIPFYLVVARAVERAVRAEGIQQLVCFLELYPLARAVYYGAKRGNPNITTVAYQHANINLMKLWYSYRAEELIPPGNDQDNFIATMPIPDLYIFQGRSGMNVLKASGYPTNRCCLTGSARYAELAVLVQDNAPSESCTEDTRDAEVTRVLVIPSLSTHDAQGLIGVTAQACGEDGQYTILVKPHPHSPVDQYVENARDRYKLKDVRMVSGNIHTLIREADVIITSYSTAGDEAIALGRPVICYSGLSPCMASFLDIEAAPIVHSADELRRSLWNMLHDPAYRRKYQDRWASLVEGSFYSLDGKASERIVEALLPRAD